MGTNEDLFENARLRLNIWIIFSGHGGNGGNAPPNCPGGPGNMILKRICTHVV